MTTEECAKRMTRFLARPPRNKKTRDYLKTLPKRPKVVVTPDEFQPTTKPAPILAKAKGGEVIAQFTLPLRRDRVRPGRRPKTPSLWNCRPDGRHRQDWSRPATDRAFRDMLVTFVQRLLLHEAQEGRCGLCGAAMEGPACNLSIDHVIPRSLLYRDELGNLLLCHHECNGRKTNDRPTGCEMVWLLNVNARLGVQPQIF